MPSSNNKKQTDYYDSVLAIHSLL